MIYWILAVYVVVLVPLAAMSRAGKIPAPISMFVVFALQFILFGAVFIFIPDQ